MRLFRIGVLVGGLMVMVAGVAQADAARAVIRLKNPMAAPLISTANAGSRVVALGDHGVVIYSDNLKDWQQAKQVPVTSLLTAASFAGKSEGWAVGHGGVVLHTTDGGNRWAVQHRFDDSPMLLSVHFQDARNGFIVGAYGFAAATHDGGSSWTRITVGAEGDDFHLNHIFAGQDGTLYIAAEAGNAYRSIDGGFSWRPMKTGVQGSLWSGLALRDGRIVLLGMSGRVLVSADKGASWTVIDAGTQQAITSGTQLPDGRLAVVGNGGFFAVSDADVKTLSAGLREDRLSAVSVASNTPDKLVLFGGFGIIDQKINNTHR